MSSRQGAKRGAILRYSLGGQPLQSAATQAGSPQTVQLGSLDQPLEPIVKTTGIGDAQERVGSRMLVYLRVVLSSISESGRRFARNWSVVQSDRLESATAAAFDPASPPPYGPAHPGTMMALM